MDSQPCSGLQVARLEGELAWVVVVEVDATLVVLLMVMITLSWPSPSLIGRHRLWLTWGPPPPHPPAPTSLASSLRSTSTRPILSSLPTSSWSNRAMSMKSSSSSYLECLT